MKNSRTSSCARGGSWIRAAIARALRKARSTGDITGDRPKAAKNRSDALPATVEPALKQSNSGAYEETSAGDNSLTPAQITSEHLQRDLPVFFVNSANFWRYPNLSYSAADKFPSQILQVLSRNINFKEVSAVSVAKFAAGVDDSKLSTLFEQYGSDKASHGYAPVYAFILERLEGRDVHVLEIGIGTNHPMAISTMGRKGRPGASLRAFRDYHPRAQLFGADIDADAFIFEERIESAALDQRTPETFKNMTDSFGVAYFDLIVDDGLHSTEANINSLLFALDALKLGGWLVIEDIPPRTANVWKLLASTWNVPGFECKLVDARTQCMFIVHHSNSSKK